MSLRTRWRFASVAVAAACVSLSAGQERVEGRQSDGSGYRAVLDNIDLLIDNYTNFLARKYDLTEEQDRYTRRMIRERCYEFIDKYSDDLGGLIDELFAVRLGGEMTQQELVEWGERAAPIYEEAKAMIIKSNDEWRETLTEEQRAQHDEDLRLMYRSFETTEDQLNRILSGEMTVEEFRNPRARASARRTAPPPPPPTPAKTTKELRADKQPEARSPVRRITPPEHPAPRRSSVESSSERAAGREERAEKTGDEGEQVEEVSEPARRRPARRPRARPRTPTGARTPRGQQPRPVAPRSRARSVRSASEDYEGQWDRYVKEFIEKYKLDDEQKQQANSILEDCKKQAARYLQSRKPVLEQLERRSEDLKTSRGKENAKQVGTELAEITRRRQELLEPIQQIFERQLKPRLERLPTRAQRRAVEQAEAKKKGSAKKESEP